VGHVQPEEGEGAHVVEGLQIEAAKAVVGEGEALEAVQVLEGLVAKLADPIAVQVEVLQASHFHKGPAERGSLGYTYMDEGTIKTRIP